MPNQARLAFNSLDKIYYTFIFLWAKLGMFCVRINPNLLNWPIKCFFDLFRSCFSNRPNWNMQWILECLLILIIVCLKLMKALGSSPRSKSLQVICFSISFSGHFLICKSFNPFSLRLCFLSLISTFTLYIRDEDLMELYGMNSKVFLRLFY